MMLRYYWQFLIAKIVNFYIGLKLVLTKKHKTDIFIMYGIVTDIFVTGFTKIVLIGTRNEIHFIADY